MLDILIIGSGPAGLSAAVYAIRANLSVKIVEKIFYGTGQIAESNMVDNYLGFAEINGYELGEKFREHAEALGVEFVEAEAVSYAQDSKSDAWTVTYADGKTEETRAVIYAAGAIHRHLGIPGENEFASKGVSYCATCDGAFFKGKKVAVFGGGDTALDDALYLAGLADKVYLVHRRDEFRSSKKTVEKLSEKENVEFVLNTKPLQIKGTEQVEQIDMEDVKTGEHRTVSVDGVFIAVGMIPMTQNVKGVVNLDANGYIVADETGVTSAKGFFAAGDVRTKALRQVVTAVADGANAVTSAEHYIKHG